MELLDKEIFEKHKHLYECFKKHGFIKNYTKDVYTSLIGLYMKYVSKQHTFSHWCSSCRMELIEALYKWYSHEKVMEEKVEPVIEPVNKTRKKRTKKI